MRKLLSLAAALLLSCWTVVAQDNTRAVADYSTHPNERMMDLRNMNPGGDLECVKSSYTGKIIKVAYADDALTITGIVIESGSNDFAYYKGKAHKLGKVEGDGRAYVNIDEDLHLRMTRFDLGYLSTLLKVGRRVRVWVNSCGAGGGVETADRIKALN